MLASLKNVLDWLQIQIDKLHTVHGIVNSHKMEGRFFVIYQDGLQSQPFDYETAIGYRNIYGGAVFHKKTGKKCYSFIGQG